MCTPTHRPKQMQSNLVFLVIFSFVLVILAHIKITMIQKATIEIYEVLTTRIEKQYKYIQDVASRDIKVVETPIIEAPKKNETVVKLLDLSNEKRQRLFSGVKLDGLDPEYVQDLFVLCYKADTYETAVDLFEMLPFSIQETLANSITEDKKEASVEKELVAQLSEVESLEQIEEPVKRPAKRATKRAKQEPLIV